MLYVCLASFAFFGLFLMSAVDAGAAADDKPVVVLETTAGTITIELDHAKAPITVENFLKYVDSGFYDNLIFHRVMKGFMIQGGGMDDKMREKDTNPPIKNEASNGLKNERGTIAMARTSNPNSATAQFFINHADNSRNLGPGGVDAYGYAVFGKVTDGMDVVDKIANMATGTRAGHGDVPLQPIYIKSAKRKGK